MYLSLIYSLPISYLFTFDIHFVPVSSPVFIRFCSKMLQIISFSILIICLFLTIFSISSVLLIFLCCSFISLYFK
ncbi:hypothetical protein ZOSMA_9G00170 [Zostera marina]|uniref:Uncharacterized protein n=1 Tax=Zostera marina TaxID=29655 RepID=A0A0K9NGL1_ZOSMR|nr:hypothetical protein ZOSMA_9G00170 [Zostera marina]